MNLLALSARFLIALKCLIYILLLTSSVTSSSLKDQLRYYETLKLKDLTHRITKRGIQQSHHKYNVIKELSFTALGRDFRLILNPTKGLLSSHFKAYTVDGKGQKQPVWVDKDQFYEGRVFGEVHSDVTAHIDDGLLTAAIQTPQDTYIVEPSWRHLPDDDNASMIIYRGSDVKFSWEMDHKGPELPKFCGFIKEDANATDNEIGDELADEEDNDVGQTSRQKRQSMDAYHWEPVQKRCSLLLVADYRFYENMGGKNLKGTINFLISLIDRVNKIFLETEWKDNEKQDGFRGMGFVIQEIMVHTEPTPTLRGEVHYNMEGGSWNVRDLLEVFSRNLNHRWFCLAHLFTDQKFDGGILGLAYVGSPRRNSVGGICSPGYVKNGYTLYLNSGLSTSRNHYGQKVITREADLVTAHEFGHNWGSEHDPDIPECSPDSKGGGSYLMYTYSVSGYDPNNKKFSPCSVRSIRAVLLAKASKCFSKPEESFCGNSLVEEGEECDAGLIGSEDNDPCCDTNCHLRPGAICCDKNAPCCRACHLVESGAPCREAEPAACKQEAYCNGVSAECPPSSPQPDNSPCQDKGRCRAGDCVPFCETMGFFSCMCDTERDACKRCCRHTVNASCVPMEPIEILRDGTPCIHGYCEKGKCEKTVQDIVERFWDIIEEININSVMKFLNDNIVGTVLLVSIVIWVPASCLISYVDRKRREESTKVTSRRVRERVPAFRPPTDSNTKLIRLNSSRSRDNIGSRAMAMPRVPPSRDPYGPGSRAPVYSHYSRSHERSDPRPYMSRGTDYHSPRGHTYSRQDHNWGSSSGGSEPRPPVRPKPSGMGGMESFTSL